MPADQETKAGLIFALSAFMLWGLAPLYFKAVAHVSAMEVLAHRIVWSVVILAAVLSWQKRWGALFELDKKALCTLLLSSLFVSSNWLIFIWAVANNRVLETSLGYFINPLVSVVLGILFLQERLRPAQALAFVLALLGVMNQIIWVGQLPWVALALALTFGFYGLLRKKLDIGPVQGLFMETILLLPLAMAYMLWLAKHQELAFGHINFTLDALLIFAGLVTTVPLLLFAAGTRRLSLTVVGLAQYTTPTMTFILAIVFFHEPFSMEQLISFAFIWTGLAVYTAEGMRYRWRALRAAA